MFASVMAALQAIAALPKLISEVKDSIDKMRESALQKEMDKIKNEVNEVIKRIEHANTKEDRLALSLKLATIVAR
jgi:glucosamine 6-phosphate synthetase-like amidotransferase/phosphosugar isomerase protein